MFVEAFTLWGSPVTWLEIAAFALSLAMVWCNILVLHWGWPLAIASSALYAALFAHSKLYAEAGLQVFFIAISIWGWRQWLRGLNLRIDDSGVKRWTPQIAAISVGAAILLSLAVGLLLKTFTDSDVPWADAIPSSMSIVAQVLLAKKYLQNWAWWLVINAMSTALFAYKGLWLTVVLYALFAVLSWVGWRAWRDKLRP